MGGFIRNFQRRPGLLWYMSVLAISGFPLHQALFPKMRSLISVFWKAARYCTGLLCLAAVLTAAYMFRLMWLVFFWWFQGMHEQEHHLHESPAAMTIPLIILAILALVGGFVQLPEAFEGKEYFNEFYRLLFRQCPRRFVSGNYRILHVNRNRYWPCGYILHLRPQKFAVSMFEGVYTGEKISCRQMVYRRIIRCLYCKTLWMLLPASPKSVVERSGIDGLVNGVGRFVNLFIKAGKVVTKRAGGQLYTVYGIVDNGILPGIWNQDNIAHFLTNIF